MIVDAQNVSFSFDESHHKGKGKILSDINLTIEKGSFVAILGRNGSGKSTLAKHLNALLTPTEGVVYVGKMDTADEENVFNIRSLAGMVFQNPDNQAVAAIVEDDVAFAPENLGVSPDEIRTRVDEALKTVGMNGFEKNTIAHLSGGQKQRVAIASVLAMNPQILILDEATAMLDPMGRREILKTVKSLNKTEKMTVILITHYMEEAAIADRTIVMDDGKIVLDAAPNEVFKNTELIKSLGLDVPQITELIYELNLSGANLKSDIIDVDGALAEIVKLLGVAPND